MPHPILDQLQADHQELARFLYSFRLYMQQLMDPGSSSDIALVLDMLDFINIYPESFHHPVEDVVFGHLMEKPDIDLSDVEQILNQHQELESFTRDIREEFHTLSHAASGSLDRFFVRVIDYIDEQNAHLYLEETRVFPLIEDSFEPADWLWVERQIEDQFPEDHWVEFQQETEQIIANIHAGIIAGGQNTPYEADDLRIDGH